MSIPSENIVNLTPHTVRLLDLNGATWGHWPSAGEARASANRKVVDTVVVKGVVEQGARAGKEWSEEFPVYRVAFGPVEGLPEPMPGVAYIVSRIAAES